MLVQTPSEVREIVNALRISKTIVVDLETTGLHPYLGDRLIGIALYVPELRLSCYLPFRHGEGFNLPLETLESFRDVLSDPSKTYYGWNVKFDQHFLTVDGFPILQNKAIYRDVMIALHTLDENRYDPSDLRGLNYKLKDNLRLYLGTEEGEEEDLLEAELKSRGLGKGDMWRLPASLVYEYAEQDVIGTWKLLQFFLPYLEKWNQVDYFNELADFNSRTLARMEYHGIRVDRDRINANISDSRNASETSLRELKAIYGNEFNPNSSQQVKQVLGTKDSRRITLERNGSIESEAIIAYKYLQKAEGTFYKPYLYFSSFDSRIHASFNASRTSSRRLSSSDPNLQQVPTYSKTYKVKEVFVADPGYKLVQLDYSQQELRLGCHFSGQQNMTEVYDNDEYDVHSLTTSYLFDIPLDMLDPKHNKEHEALRKIGKVANFGFGYGMGIMKAATYIAASTHKALYIDKRFYVENLKFLPKVPATKQPIYSETETTLVVSSDEWGGNQIVRQVPIVVGYTDGNRDMTWEEFQARFDKYYAGTIVMQDSKQAEQDSDGTGISIWTTTKILWDWKKLYGNFVNGLKGASALASQWRNPDGTPSDPEHGYRFYRLADGCVRHYIKGQRPFTAWNLLVQGTGATMMRRALMRINDRFDINQDEVIPLLSVHDSDMVQVKENENFHANVMEIKRIMEDYPEYHPAMKVDIKVGYNWGELEDYEV